MEIVLKALSESWGPDTCQSDFDPDNKSKGQCCVSTLVLQHYFGGVLLRGKTNKGTVHYWLRLNEAWIDPTREQFPPDEYIVVWDDNPPMHLWWFEDTEEKFKILLKRVQSWITQQQSQSLRLFME